MSEDFRVLAQRRLDEAVALLAASQWSGAYYLAGYANECALKAVALKSIQPYQMPDKQLVSDLYTHGLVNLAKAAGLAPELQREQNTNPSFTQNWLLAKDWNESSRYDTWSPGDAADLVSATSDPVDGVFQWVKGFW